MSRTERGKWRPTGQLSSQSSPLFFCVCALVTLLWPYALNCPVECYGGVVQASLQERIAELEQRLDMVILAMGELGKNVDTRREEENAPSMGYHTLSVLALQHTRVAYRYITGPVLITKQQLS